MIGSVTYALAAYFAIAMAGIGLRRGGREAAWAGVTGIVITAIHALTAKVACGFDPANFWLSTGFGVFFVCLYAIRDVIHGDSTNDDE